MKASNFPCMSMKKPKVTDDQLLTVNWTTIMIAITQDRNIDIWSDPYIQDRGEIEIGGIIETKKYDFSKMILSIEYEIIISTKC